MQVVRAVGGPGAAAPDLRGKLFLAARRSAARAGLRHAYRPRRATPATASPTSAPLERGAGEGAQVRRLRATTKSWSWACAAWPPASATTKASWWPGCRSRRPPTVWRNGWMRPAMPPAGEISAGTGVRADGRTPGSRRAALRQRRPPRWPPVVAQRCRCRPNGFTRRRRTRRPTWDRLDLVRDALGIGEAAWTCPRNQAAP
jgi:hypothetical protein